MKKNQIVALILGAVLVGLGFGYELNDLLVPRPEPEIIEKIIYEPTSNLLRGWYLTGERGLITLTNQHYSMFSGPLLRGVSLELVNCSNIVIHQPFIWTNYSYGIRLVGCVNVTILDFYIKDADIGIIVVNSSDCDFGYAEFDDDGEPIYNSIIENWGSYPFKVLNSDRISIAGVNASVRMQTSEKTEAEE